MYANDVEYLNRVMNYFDGRHTVTESSTNSVVDTRAEESVMEEDDEFDENSMNTNNYTIDNMAL